ncbi:hypothetical protein FRC01_007168, partial [Tulasnella sp. 417]
PVLHTFYHDLESIFWGLTYLVLREEQSYLALSKRGASMLCSKVDKVFSQKQSILSDAFGTMAFIGRFKDLEQFLKAFAEACWDHHKKRRTLEFQGVIEMADRALESLPPG